MYFGYTIKILSVSLTIFFFFCYTQGLASSSPFSLLLFHTKAQNIISLNHNSFQLLFSFLVSITFLSPHPSHLSKLINFSRLQACQSTSFPLITFSRSRRGLKIIIIVGEFNIFICFRNKCRTVEGKFIKFLVSAFLPLTEIFFLVLEADSITFVGEKANNKTYY